MAIIRVRDENGKIIEIPAFAGPTGPVGPAGPAGADGEDGETPVRGVDYWTEDDKAEIKSYVDTAILGGAW